MVGFREREERVCEEFADREREELRLISKSNGRVCEELINCIRFPRVKRRFKKKLEIMRNGVWREGKHEVFISKENCVNSK